MATRLFSALIVFLALAAQGARAAGTPIFFPPASFDSGASATEWAVAADVNRDGNPDMIVAIQNDPNAAHTTNGVVSVLFGRGDGTFGTPVLYDSAGSDPASLAVADLNGDGAPDIVVANLCVFVNGACSTTTVGVLLNHGDGTFAPAVPWSLGGTGAEAVAVADINGDGNADILATVGVSSSGAVAVLLGKGDGTFLAPGFVLLGSVSLNAIAIGDLNGDRRPDAVVSGSTLSGATPSQGIVRVLLGNGDGTFLIAPAIYDSGVSAGGWANSVALGDLNGDGAVDLAVANYPDSTTGILLGNGDGTFRPAKLYDSGSPLAWVDAIADVNGDSVCDVIVAHAPGVVSVLLGNGDGTLQPPETYQMPGDALSVVAADVNRDGKLDLAVANGSRLTSVLLNNAPCNGGPPLITVAAAPTILWPPNGKMMPVTVSGTIAGAGCQLNLSSPRFVVLDEYGQVQPAGSIVLGADGAFALSVPLEASRRGDDTNGRQYAILISAQNESGKSASAVSVVTVPHNR